MWSCTTEIRGVLLLNECTDTSSSCCRKRYMHLPLSDLCVQYPETPSTLHCSQVQPELKENGFSQLIPQYSMQLQTRTARVEGKWLFTVYSSIQYATADTYAVQDMASFIFMQCMTESSWSSEAFQDLNSNPFWRLMPWTGLRSLPLSVLANTGSPDLSACYWILGALETH